MASSKVVSTNTDLPRDSPSSSSSSSSSCIISSSSSSSLSNFLLSDLPSNSMDDLLKSIYPPPPPPPPPPNDTKSQSTFDDVWKDIVTGGSNHHHHHNRPSSDDAVAAQITLEDFLAKARAVTEEDVREGGVMNMSVPGPVPSSSTLTPPPPPPHFPLLPPPSNPPSSSHQQSNGNNGKGKRRAVEEPLDKATLQKQKRMIKNRESAARSRERKQAYTSELESLVQQLEEENERLVNDEAEKEKKRFKQLVEFVLPVVEKRKPKRRLRRTNSTQSL